MRQVTDNVQGTQTLISNGLAGSIRPATESELEKRTKAQDAELKQVSWQLEQGSIVVMVVGWSVSVGGWRGPAPFPAVFCSPGTVAELRLRFVAGRFGWHQRASLGWNVKKSSRRS